MAEGAVRIVHLIPYLRTGGAEMMLLKLLERMDRRRFQCSVMTVTADPPMSERIRALGIKVGFPGIDRARWAEGTRPDVVQGWMYHGNMLTVPLKALLPAAAVAWNVRCDFRGASFSLKARASARACALFSRHVPDVIIFNSLRARDSHLRLGYRARDMRVIPNGFDLERFRPSEDARAKLRESLRLAPETGLIGMIARFTPREKDHGTFLEAAARLVRARSGAHFLLCGPGMSADNGALVSEIEARGLSGWVHLLGERRDMPDVTAGLDVAALVSHVEGFPNVIGEAMACGVPVVATDVGDCRDIVGEAGIIVPPRDPDALAGAWRKLLEAGREGRERVGRLGRERVAALYDLGKIVHQYEDLYEKLARGVRSACGARTEDGGVPRCAESAAR